MWKNPIFQERKKNVKKPLFFRREKKMSKNPIFQERKKNVKKPHFSGEKKKFWSKNPIKKIYSQIHCKKFEKFLAKFMWKKIFSGGEKKIKFWSLFSVEKKTCRFQKFPLLKY